MDQPISVRLLQQQASHQHGGGVSSGESPRRHTAAPITIREGAEDNSDATSDEEEEIMVRWQNVVDQAREEEEQTRQQQQRQQSTRTLLSAPASPSVGQFEPYASTGGGSAMNIPSPLIIPTSPPIDTSGSETHSYAGATSVEAQMEGAGGGMAAASPSRRRTHSRAKSVRRTGSPLKRRVSHLAGLDALPLSADTSSSKQASVAKPPRKSKWATARKRLPYYLPFLSWIPAYNFRANLMGDLLGGLTVGIMLVPQGLTYANLANLPPQYGLFTAFFPLLIYSLLGSSRHLSVGPEVTSSILIGKTILSLPSIPSGDMDSPEVTAALVSAALGLSFLVGIITLLLGLTRLGFIDSILSKPVLTGFVIAVAMSLICEQLPALLGLQCGRACKPGTLPLDLLMYSLKHVPDASWITCLISVGSCSFMLVAGRLKHAFPDNRVLACFPDILVVVVLTTAISYALDLPKHGVATLGSIKEGFPTPAMPELDQGSMSQMLSGAITIAVLGFVETQLVNKRFGGKHGYSVSPNRELVALGACSFIAPFFGAYSAFGSLPRTKGQTDETRGTRARSLGARARGANRLL